MKDEAYFAKIVNLQPVGGNVFDVSMELEESSSFCYRAGQYVEMYLNDEKCRIFSIASSPDAGRVLQFHLRDVEDGALEAQLKFHFNERFAVKLAGPKGDYQLQLQSDKPLIFLAGGTGFAPIKSMLEFGMQHGMSRDVYLYWGARTQEELYGDAMVKQWADAYPWLHYVPVLSDQAWSGRMGYVHEALLEDITNLAEYDVYASGAPLMIKASYEAFLDHGLPSQHYYSDILDYALSL